MPMFEPLGPLRGVSPFEAIGAGVPKRRGPQGQDNRGDAGLPKGLYSIYDLPQMKLPPLQMEKLEFGGFEVMDEPVPSIQMPPQERPPIEHTKTFGGWVKNLWADIESFAAAIPATIKVAWQAGSEILGNYEWLPDLYKQPELLTRELDLTTRKLIKGFTDTYTDGIGEALYKHPFTVALDALAVADLAGGAIKRIGTTAARMGGGTAAETVARMAESNLVKLGQSIQSFPGRMVKKPFELTARALEKTPFVADVMRAKALTGLGREEAKRLGSFKLDARAKAEPFARNLLSLKLKKGEREFLNDLTDGVVPRSEIKSQKLLDRYDEWKKRIDENERDFLDLGIFTKETLVESKLKQTAISLKNRGHYPGEVFDFDAKGNPVLRDDARAFVEGWISGRNPWNAQTVPVYRPFTHERSFNIADLMEALRGGKDSEHFRKWVSRFEKRTGLGVYVEDPDVWQARSLLQKADLDATIGYWQDSVRRLGKPLKGGRTDKGYRLAPPLLERYIKGDLVNAQTLLLQNLSEGMRKADAFGLDKAQMQFEGIAHTREQLLARLEEIKSTLDEARANPAQWAVQVPDEVAYLMEKSLVGPRGFWRFYDNLLDTWRDTLLTFMPRYYVNNLLGNAVLLLYGGYTPGMKRLALRADELPGEGLQSMMAAEAGYNSSYLARIAPEAQKGVRRFAAQMAEVTDSRARQVFLAQMAPEIIEHDAILGSTHAQALMAMESAEDAVSRIFQARREVLGSPLEELRETRLALKGAEKTVTEIRYKRAEPRVGPEEMNKGLALREALERERSKVSRVPRKAMHFTTAESASALKGGQAYDVSRLPVHGTGDLGAGVRVGKFAGDRIYLSLDDKAWSQVLKEKPGEGRVVEATQTNPKEGVRFYDYAKQKWMVNVGGHELHKLSPVEFFINPDAKILVINSVETLQKAVQEASQTLGRRVFPKEDPSLFEALALRYDILEIRNVKNIDHDFFHQAKADQAIVFNPAAVEVARQGQASRFATGGPDVRLISNIESQLRKRPSTQQAQAEAAFGEMLRIQRSIRTERSLRRMDPEAAQRRISDLEEQLKLKGTQLEQLSPGYLRQKVVLRKITDQPEIGKIAEIQARREALEPFRNIAEKVVERTETFFGNYGRLHPISREYIRRVIPFWTWTSTMFALGFQLPFLRPRRTFMWHHFGKMMIDSLGDDRLPNRYRSMLPIGGDENGNVIFLRIGGFNPFERFTERGQVAGVPIPGFINPTTNPFVKIAIESTGGYDTFLEKPFVGMTDFVSLNGTVWRLDSDSGRIEPIIPQKPIIASLLNQMPHMKLIGELLAGAGLPEAGGALGVRTPKNPDGTYTYDRQIWFALSRAFGFPASVQNPERVKLQHFMLKKGMAARFRSASRRVDPETRMQLESILADLERSEVWEN